MMRTAIASYLLKRILNSISLRLKNNKLKICQNFQKVKLQFNILKLSCALVLINNANVGILDSVLKRFKYSGEMAIKNAVQRVLQNPPTRTSDE